MQNKYIYKVEKTLYDTKSTGLNHLALIPTIIPKILPRQRDIPGKEITYALILHPGLLSSDVFILIGHGDFHCKSVTFH